MGPEREPVSAVMGIRMARLTADREALDRALTAWQWERLDRRDALTDHVRDCQKCEYIPDNVLIVTACRKGTRLAGALWKAKSRVTEFRFLLDTCPHRNATLF